MANSNKIDWYLADKAVEGVLSRAFPAGSHRKDIQYGVSLSSGTRVLNPVTLEFSDGTTLIEQQLAEPARQKKAGRRIKFAGDDIE